METQAALKIFKKHTKAKDSFLSEVKFLDSEWSPDDGERYYYKFLLDVDDEEYSKYVIYTVYIVIHDEERGYLAYIFDNKGRISEDEEVQEFLSENLPSKYGEVMSVNNTLVRNERDFLNKIRNIPIEREQASPKSK